MGSNAPALAGPRARDPGPRCPKVGTRWEDGAGEHRWQPGHDLAAWIRSFPQQRLRCASTAFASWRPGGADSAAPHLPQAWAPLKARARTLRCAFDFPEEGNGDPGEVGEASAAVPTVFPGGTKTPQVLLPGTSRSPASGWRGGVGNGRQKLLEAGSGVRLPGLDTMGCRILSTPSSVSAVPVSLCLSLFFFFFGLGFHYFLRLHLHAFPLPNSHRRATGGCGGAVAAAAAARRLRGRGGGGGSQEAGFSPGAGGCSTTLPPSFLHVDR
ncbi:uncharacterized protein isoform X1 [Castor canadensis]|uniref:Uncharacterized protein isoform X1 n=15 Tax=Castor canadensis TaxID=51338 RepID=A0AC58KGD9_CASCN